MNVNPDSASNPAANTAANTAANSIVIIGGGHAGAQLCASLAEAGQGGAALPAIHLVCEEVELPYQRPPLSKAFLKKPDEALQTLRAEAWYAERNITLHRADAALSIDRERKIVRLRSGTELPYTQLVLATGTRARRLPGLPESLSNVAVLRNAADAVALRERLHATKHLTVLGGGFIGLEIAATARGLGVAVDVLESAPRLLARSVSPELAAHVQAGHTAAGVNLRLGVRVGEFEVEHDAAGGGKLVALQVDGVREPVELMVLGIGAVPEETLAREAGLEVSNGIVVDGCLRSSDPTILAIGDCTSFPEHSHLNAGNGASGRRLRLESVQNANDQARTAAATLLGRADEAGPYRALPWFWSEQGAMRLQMTGLMPADGVRHRRPGASDASFSLLHYVGDTLVCAESVNAPADHMMLRKLLEAGRSPSAEAACDAAQALKSFL